MNTFDPKDRKVKTYAQFLAAKEKVNKEDKSASEIVKDGYSGGKEGKKGVDVLDDRIEKRGKHETVKSNYSGDRKGKKGTETLEETRKYGMPFPEKIVTAFIHPPVKDGKYDWQATYGDYEEGDLIGYGATEEEAIEDLKKQFDE